MKVNIKKLQMGGLVTFKPLPMLPQSQPAPQAASEDKVIKDDMLEKMIGKGITSDVMTYANQLNSVYNTYSSLPESIKNSPEGQMMRQQMKGSWAQLNALERSKDRFDKIIEARKQAMPEVAVIQGKVIAQDLSTGQLQSLSIGDYASSLKDKDNKYRALTNSQLAYLRENDNDFAGRDDLFSILENSVSTDEITKEVRGVLTNLGHISEGDSDVSYEQKQIGEGAQGLLSIKNTEGKYRKTNKENLKAAANTMWANLKDNSKDLLRVKAAQYGYAPEQIESAAMGLAVSLLNPALIEEIKLNSGSGSGSGGASEGKQGIYQAAAKLDLPKESIQLNLGTNKSAFMTGYVIPNLPKQNGEWRGPTFVEDMPELNSIADPSNGVYIGDQLVKPTDYDGLLWDGGKSYVVLMPVKHDPENNRMMPDVTASKRLTEAEKEISKIKNITPNLKREIYNRYGFYDLDPKDNKPVIGRTVYPFLAFQGTISDALIENPNSDTLSQLKGRDAEDYEERYRTNDKGKKVSKPGYGFFSKFARDVVKSTVYIPMRLGGPLLAHYMEQGSVGVAKEEGMSATYDRVGWGGKEDPKMGAVTQIQGNLSTDYLKQKTNE